MQKIKDKKWNSYSYKIKQGIIKCQKQIISIGNFTIQKRSQTILYKGSIRRLSRICEKRKSKSPPK